ncbi:MAG: hypothetical protein EXS05_18375 [Planctomycetaceae bacterium]|nr:hypothetical protein [Planctomycetaceae bacterium]
MLEAIVIAFENFTIENVSGTKRSSDVPRVTVSLRSGRCQWRLEFDNWFRDGDVGPEVQSGIRRFVELSGGKRLAEDPIVRRAADDKSSKYTPRTGTDWQVWMTIRDAADGSVEWKVDENQELSIHGELSLGNPPQATPVGWYSKTLNSEEVQDILDGESGCFNEFRFQPKGKGGQIALDVAFTIRSGEFAATLRREYESLRDFPSSSFGRLLKLAARGREKSFANRLPPELLGENPGQ